MAGNVNNKNNKMKLNDKKNACLRNLLDFSHLYHARSISLSTFVLKY